MRKWLARLAFSFIVLAAWQVWEGRRARDRGESGATWHYVAAGLLAGAGMAGMRSGIAQPESHFTCDGSI